MRPIISSRKHIRQIAINSVMGGTLTIVKAIHAKQDADAIVPEEVDIGTTIKAVYIELWILAGSQQPGSFTVSVEKLNGSLPTMTFADSALMHTYTNKANVLYTTQGVSPDANGNPVPIIRTWIKIPRGKQRFALNDKLHINMSANVEDMTHCGLVIFKGYN